MELIDNASQLLKMRSVQVAGVTGLLAIAEQLVPGLQGVVPPIAYTVLMGLLVLARAIKQSRL